MELGIYVHIPFCVKKCDYCDFISYSNFFDMQEKYVEKLLKPTETPSQPESKITMEFLMEHGF